MDTTHFDLAKNYRLMPSLSLRARRTAVTAYTPAPVASSTTPVSRAALGADRWKIFLSGVSHEAATSGFDASRQGSIAARWWHGRVPAAARVAVFAGGTLYKRAIELRIPYVL
jgi:hypothetical protein